MHDVLVDVVEVAVRADALREVSPVVIDFEYTTPTGAAPEPIEIAVQALRVRDGKLERTARWEALMRPPQHAELTTFDINQTGITRTCW